MVQLRSKDYSYRKIADELNRSEIPTKTGNAPWKATTVMKICKRASKSRHEVLGHAGIIHIDESVELALKRK